MPAVQQHSTGDVLAWCHGGDVSSVVQYSFQGKDVIGTSLALASAQEPEEVDTGKFDWSEVCCIQSFCVRMAQAEGIISVAPQMQLLVGAGARHRLGTAKGLEDDDVAQIAPSDEGVDVTFWLPPKPKQYKAAGPKTTEERPKEGVITPSKPNKNLQHRQVVEVESRKVSIYKFGSRGDSGGNNKAVTDSAQRSGHRGDAVTSDIEGSDVDDWRWPSVRVRKRIKKIAQSLQNKNAALSRCIGAPCIR